jgi:hypothetical protein
MATARTASHGLSASAALTAVATRKPMRAVRTESRAARPGSARRPGPPDAALRRWRRVLAASATAAAAPRATSLGTKNRSSSNTLYGRAAIPTSTAADKKARVTPEARASGSRPNG